MQDGVGGAVIFLQPDDLGIWEKLFELKDVGDLRAAPAVDRLVVISDDADMEMRRADELLEELHLEGIGVLELVHRDAGIPEAKHIPDIRVLTEDFLGEQQQVVEIHGVLRAQLVLIGGAQHREIIVLQLGGIDALVLGFGNGGKDIVRLHLLRRATFPDEQLLHHADLVGVRADREIRLVAELADATAEDPHAERVEGTHGHGLNGLFRDHTADPLAHLAGSLVREGNGEDLRGLDPLLQHVGDAAGHGAGLAGAGTCQEHDRAVEGAHGFALGLIQGVKGERRGHRRADGSRDERRWQ